MANALVALNYIKQSDGTYRLHFPINTTNEVYYDIENNVTLKKYLSTITPGGIMHTVETDEDRLALTVATVKLMDVVKVTGDKNALYYVTDIEKLGTEEGFTPFVDPNKFVSKENGTGEEGGTTIINDAFVGESPSNTVTYGDMIIDMPKGLEDGTVNIDMTVKNANTVNFDYINQRVIGTFPEQDKFTQTLRSCLSPNGLYMYVEVSDGTIGKGIVYNVNGTKLTYMNTVMSFTDLTSDRSCNFTKDNRCILIADSVGIHVAYRSADDSIFIYMSNTISTIYAKSISYTANPNIIIGVNNNTLKPFALSMTTAYNDAIPSITCTDISSTYFTGVITNFSVTRCITSKNGEYLVFATGEKGGYIFVYTTSETATASYYGVYFQAIGLTITDIAISEDLKYVGVCSQENWFTFYSIENFRSPGRMRDIIIDNVVYQSCAFTYGSEALVGFGYRTDGEPKRVVSVFNLDPATGVIADSSRTHTFINDVEDVTDILISPTTNCGYVLHNGHGNITPFISNGIVLEDVVMSSGTFISPMIAMSNDGKYCASVSAYGNDGISGTINLYKVIDDGSMLHFKTDKLPLNNISGVTTTNNPTIHAVKWIDNMLFISHTFTSASGSENRVSIYRYVESTDKLILVNTTDYINSMIVTDFIRSEYIESTAWLTYIVNNGDYIHFYKLTNTTSGTIIDNIKYGAGWNPNATIIDVAFYKRYMVVLYNASPYIKILKYADGSNGYSTPETTYNTSLSLGAAPTSIQINTSAKTMIITYNTAPYVEVFTLTDVGNNLDHRIAKIDDSTHVNLPTVPLQWSKLIYGGKYILFCKNGTPKEYYFGTVSGSKLAIIKSGKLDDAIINSSIKRPDFDETKNLLIEKDDTRPYAHVFKTTEIPATTSIHIEGKLDKATNSWTNAIITSSNDANIENIYLTYNEETGRACIVIIPKYDTWFEGYVSIDRITYQGVSNIDTKYEVSFGDFLTSGDYTNLYEYIKEVESNTNELLNNRSVVTKDVIENVEITTDGWVNKLDTLGYYVYTIKSDLIKSTSTVMMDVIGVLGAEIANNASVISNTTEYNGYSEIYAVDLPTGSFFVNITIIN